MTRVEALSEVLRDAQRSQTERNQAICILRDIASNGAESDERLAAERVLADLPRSQPEEDRLIELAMDDPRITRDDPRYGERLARLCGDLWADAYMFAGALAPAEQHVADLISLFGRTASTCIRNPYKA